MSFLKTVLNFYVNASIHVAIAVYAFVRTTEYYFGLSHNEYLNSFIFFGTITGYNFVKYAGVAKLHHRSLTHNLKIIQIFSLVCFFAMCYYALHLSIETLIFTIPFVGLTFLYAVPFLSGFDKSLREVSYLKILVVAFVWSGFTVLIPLLAAGKEISSSMLLCMLQRFLIVIVLILPFDIRDVKYDAINLQTIPKKIGEQRTKRLGVLLLVFSLILEYFISSEVRVKMAFMMFFFLVIVFLMRSKTAQSKYYSSFWVELLPIVWWLLL